MVRIEDDAVGEFTTFDVGLFSAFGLRPTL